VVRKAKEASDISFIFKEIFDTENSAVGSKVVNQSAPFPIIGTQNTVNCIPGTEEYSEYGTKFGFFGVRSMNGGLLEYGRLILPPSSEVRAFVVFFPPATGEHGQQEAEAKDLAASGIACLLYDPPYRRMRQGGLADPAGELALWENAKSEFQVILCAVASDFPSASGRIAVVGKNLGGSVAAYSSSSAVQCLIVTGAVPALSEFWTRSAHPTAGDARQGLSTAQLEEFRRMTHHLDLRQSILSVRGSVLVQFGSRDPWIDSAQCQSMAHIEWLDDDHAMNASSSIENRRAFLEKTLCGLREY
jgi:hypothetical protein